MTYHALFSAIAKERAKVTFERLGFGADLDQLLPADAEADVKEAQRRIAARQAKE